MERREFLKSTTKTAGTAATLLVAGCSKTYRPTRPDNVLREGKDGMLAKLSDLPRDYSTLVYAKMGTLILVRVGKEVKAYKSICPHTMCEINDGFVSQPLRDNKIRCWIHDSYFEAKTGKYIKGPANPGSTLPRVKIRLKNDAVYLVKKS